jgi:cytochrome P450 PksS
MNLASGDFKANPFPFYSRLRADSPVFKTTLPTGESAWLITRYDDVAFVLKDERFVKNAANAMSPAEWSRLPWFRRWFKLFRQNMLNQDPPVHQRLRSLVNKSFTPTFVEQLRGRIQQLTSNLLDEMEHKTEIDLIRDFALPLPIMVIAEMLGIDMQSHDRFHRWSDDVVAAARSTWALMRSVPSALLLVRYIRKIVRKRRDNQQSDLVSILIQAEDETGKLSDQELVSMIFLLLIAGHETTANLIGNGMLALFEHPNQLSKLRNEPLLIGSAIEEMLRFTSPVDMATERYAREEVTIAGVTIKRTDMVVPAIVSANRDERQFPDPDVFDISRSPNKHLAFGAGAHFCVGAALARLEAQIAFNSLLERFPNLRPANAISNRRWRNGLLIRGLESLPLAVK